MQSAPVPKLTQLAIERGLVAREKALNHAAAINLIVKPHLYTKNFMTSFCKFSFETSAAYLPFRVKAIKGDSSSSNASS